MFPFSVAMLAAFLSAVALVPIARALAVRLGAVDAPDGKRKLQTRAVPLCGGVAVYVALLFGLIVANLFWNGESDRLLHLSLVVAVTAGFVCIVGAVDDIIDLNPRIKLLLQFTATIPIVCYGYFVDGLTVFGVPIQLGWLGIPLTMCWIVGCINAINLLDGLDGLASTVGISSLGMMALIALNGHHPHVALIAITLAGALAGFLVYNFPPASIYLGDSGSMVIGFVVGILAIQASLKATATLSLSIPAVILTIPMLDTMYAILRRRLSGKRFDAADRGHIHHCLLNRGLSKWQALCFIGSLCLMTGAAATAAMIIRSDAVAWLVAVSVVVFLIKRGVFGNHELMLLKLSIANVLSRFVQRLIDSSTAKNHASESLEYANLDLDQAWQHFVAITQKWNVDYLCLSVVEGHSRRQLQKYDLRNTEAAPHRRWSLSFDTPSATGETCQLQLSGNDSGASQSIYLLEITRIARIFTEYCADATLAGETLPDEQTILSVERLPEDRSLQPVSGEKKKAA